MCKSDDVTDYDCSAISCIPSLSELYLEPIASENAENLLANETYTASDITISGTETVEFSIQVVSEKSVLTLSDSEWDTGTYDYVLSVGDKNSLDLTLKLERSGGKGCCSNTLLLDSFEIDGEVQEEDTFLTYKIPISNIDKSKSLIGIIILPKKMKLLKLRLFLPHINCNGYTAKIIIFSQLIL